MTKFSYLCGSNYEQNLNFLEIMKRLTLLFAAVALAVSAVSAQVVQTPVKGKTGIRLYDKVVPRTEIILPQIQGYNCYKADFHTHTIYSDGEITPRERMREAWYDGLDIIAITDHLEIRRYEKYMLRALAPYNPDGVPYKYANAGAGNKNDKNAPMLSNLNACFEEALHFVEKEKIPVLPVRGTEIWRSPKTTGEYNALFLKDINAICTADLFECFRRVKEQGGIIIHNHPGWNRPTMDKSEDQERIYAEGWVDGIEVVNGRTLYPQMIDRCINEKLFISASTDLHIPSSQRYPRGGEIFRTHTIVLAKELTEEAVKEALKAHRTIGYSANNFVGEQYWLNELLNAAVICQVIGVDEEAGKRTFLFTNTCSVPFILKRGKATHKLLPFQSLRINISRNKETEEFYPPTFDVLNMWTAGDKHPRLTFEIDK